MAAPYNPPVKNEDFKVPITLADMAVPGSLKSSPTIAAGDFKVSKDGAAFNNLTTLPVVLPAGSVGVMLELSASEMNADVLLIVGIDQSTPKEWCDFSLGIPTTSA
jgi:hypothetical protein